MKAKKTLFVAQEMFPYVPETDLAVWGRKMPQLTQEAGNEIRTFMPKWGIINERRNQLHEVIRLSGMNMVVDDTDHPLIIKVASIPSARMQIYFIDNEEYFTKRQMTFDENGVEYHHNAERACFYALGVLETIKKLRWMPDVIHCQGWISSFIPMLVKTAYAGESSFCESRTVFTPTNPDMKAPLPPNMNSMLKFCGVGHERAFKGISSCKNMQIMNRMGVKWADGVTMFDRCDDLRKLAVKLGKPVMDHPQDPTQWQEAYTQFYDQLTRLAIE